ncbi:MAG: thioredoxin domain-containing protein [Deltaproteobacteria bacterium]|jgi:uncharacterized protein YyaL (SSP411 family)|nr:thioredoxin domain-containing protein [Deltaproteobacteria bacterium]
MNLLDQYSAMRLKRGPSYIPRTQHLGPDGWAVYTNRLFLESSPYLLQHAHNPVDWYPWGDEAFQTAASLDRPVLLSVGYSTCHWCHVMEEESFEDEEIARYINENYIAIKVDREERPDIDAIYMAAVQALTGRGGWPMTVWLTPNRKPFYGGTYYPARDGDRGAGVGFLTLLGKIRESYQERRDLVNQSSQQLTEAVNQMLVPDPVAQIPGKDIMRQAFQSYQSRYDRTNGGLSGAPKFPSSLPIRFLFRYFQRFNATEALNMATQTLDKMAAGGLYDHVGGGFHRYATDEKWLVPHFEKMLYDNALLVMDYLEGYQVTGNPKYKRIAEKVLHYVQRDMTSSGGAFFSATDADSLTPQGHREEGYFFTWTPEELDLFLDPNLAALIRETHAVGSSPNFEGRHILNTPESMPDLAKRLQLEETHLRSQVKKALKKLRDGREHRTPPLRDEKILTAWNGLMISAFARAGFVLDDPGYVAGAVRAAKFVLEHLFLQGKLHLSYMNGVARHNGYLEDYAFLTAGLIDLYEATHEIRWLEQALVLDKNLGRFFEDRENGGFFMTGMDHENLIAREKPKHDGALPSGNAIATMNLLRLGAFTSNADYFTRAEKALRAFSGTLSASPTAMAEFLLALDNFLVPPKEIVIIEPKDQPGSSHKLLDKLRRQYLPGRIIVVAREGEDVEAQMQVIPLMNHKTAVNHEPTVYVCENKTCQAPTNDPNVLAGHLDDDSSKL